MALIIGVVSQKGGVGKSTLARMIACEYASGEWDVKIIDMDLSQGTSTAWNSRRMQNEIKPALAVEQFLNVKDALKKQDSYDLLVFDGAPHSTRRTLEIAQAADILILPTGVSLDDLEPTIKLAHELRKNKIPINKINIALSRIGNSTVELEEAKEYIDSTGYHVLTGMLLEKTAIRRAQDEGRAASETSFKSVNQKSDVLIQAIVDRIEAIKL
jgi:chromosome partitioning protein